ncbi:MAG: ATP-binding protein [Chitinophagaceae bacterium]|nr:ATP-binding protein [Chitinophagaceae bacterium]
MLQLTSEFKKKVLEALMAQRANYDGSDAAFSKTIGINQAVFSQLKNGKTEGLVKDSQWLNWARELGISLHEREWNIARTAVLNVIEQEVKFCKRYAKSRICVDECGIGKTFTAKYLSRTLKNCFYVDASQCKSKQHFVRTLAKTLGVDHTGKYNEVKANLKYYIKMLPSPVIIVDEAGDLEYPALLELKELWNATDGACGWYLMGADGLRAKIERGIANKKVGFRELFSRFSEKFTSIVPADRQEKLAFYRQLITDVLSANMANKAQLEKIVKRCLTTDEIGHIGGLRRAEALLILNTQ